MVFQHFGLLPHLDVLDNVAYPLRVQGMGLEERQARAREMIELVGLAGRERHRSGSCRAACSSGSASPGASRSSPIWFLDEPFSALDPLIRRQMQDEFLRLQWKLRKSIVFITHDFQEALRLADRIAIMRQGRIVQIGTAADLVLNPADDYVAEFTAMCRATRCSRRPTSSSRGGEQIAPPAGRGVPSRPGHRADGPGTARAGGGRWAGRPIGRITPEGVVGALAQSGGVRVIAAEMAGIGTGGAAATRSSRPAVISERLLGAAALALAVLVIGLYAPRLSFCCAIAIAHSGGGRDLGRHGVVHRPFPRRVRAITWLFNGRSAGSASCCWRCPGRSSS